VTARRKFWNYRNVSTVVIASTEEEDVSTFVVEEDERT
jgi:hypothetical protein